MAYQTCVSSNLAKKHSEVETILTKDNIYNYNYWLPTLHS